MCVFACVCVCVCVSTLSSVYVQWRNQAPPPPHFNIHVTWPCQNIKYVLLAERSVRPEIIYLYIISGSTMDHAKRSSITAFVPERSYRYSYFAACGLSFATSYTCKHACTLDAIINVHLPHVGLVTTSATCRSCDYICHTWSCDYICHM